MAYEKLGRHADAESVRKKFQGDALDSPAYQYATIYAQWGDNALVGRSIYLAFRAMY
jgi:hypothetical protein